ncbi:HAMP domain-containing histidine kinase [Edaphobacter sp. HDX4]|uniref:sensor histidine kinase n=1 Tax=Edaphobacter sp. HDX4 TaxID=2794064 RepID=UPI002FE507AA
MTTNASITRRLTVSILLLELFAALALITTVTNHERHVRFETFDANLRGTCNALLGAVQEADSKDGSVQLDLTGMSFPSRAIYRVTVDNGQILGARGTLPSISVIPGSVTRTKVQDRPFRFYMLKGERVIDPGSPGAVNHHVTVIYGVPEGDTWHAVFEEARFFSIATVALLGITTLLISWLIRRFLLPIRELAHEAEKVSAERWTFHAPDSSKRFVELRPLASAIEKALARLEGSFQQQRRFTSDAAHEIKTDLAIIKSSVQLLSMRRRTVEEYEQGLILGLEDIGRLESTIQKMLALARLEQGPKADRETSDLAEIVEDVIVQSQPYADIKEVEVITENLQIGVEVLLDREDAMMLFSNVLLNALQHSSTNGLVKISMMTDRETVVLRIRDYGEGISEEDRPFLFDAFYRGDASRSRKSGGTGLGLSICKAICDRAGGSIGIANHPDGGAEVEIRFPIFSRIARAT